jgi:hypothetical protein
VNNLVDAFVAQLQWTNKVETGANGVEREDGEGSIEQEVRQGAMSRRSEKTSAMSQEESAQKPEKAERIVDRSLVDRDREERDV